MVEADACHGEIHQDLHGVMTLWLALGPKAERDVWLKDCGQRKQGSTWRSRLYIGVGSERKLALMCAIGYSELGEL
jgi:hypothetical protein